KLGLQFVANELQRFAEAGGGRAVAAHADLDWLAHAGFLYTDATIWPSAAGVVESSKIWRTAPMNTHAKVAGRIPAAVLQNRIAPAEWQGRGDSAGGSSVVPPLPPGAAE